MKIMKEYVDGSEKQEVQIQNMRSDFEGSESAELTDDERIDLVAEYILKKFKPAFEELAKW